MSIVRVERKTRFTVVPNGVIEDDRLSFRARGVLAYLLSKPDNWTARSEQLVTEGKEGRDAIRTALRELEDCGYLTRDKEQIEGGRWVTVTTIRDHSTEDGFPGVGNPDVGESVATTKTEQLELSNNSRKTTKTSSSPSSSARKARRDEVEGGWEDPVQRKLSEILPSQSPVEPDEAEPGPKRLGRTTPDSAWSLNGYYREKVFLANQGVLGQTNDKAMRKFFADAKRQGVSADVLRAMVDEFVEDTRMFGTARSRWRVFISNASRLQQRAQLGVADYRDGAEPDPSLIRGFGGSIPQHILDEILTKFPEEESA